MKNEEKQLLTKDLCARLPYGVIMQLNLLEGETINSRLTGIDEDGNLTADVPADCAFSIKNAKPYLRSLESMTKEEKAIYSNYKIVVRGLGIVFEYNLDFVTEWLLKHHFDYRGLIEKGLALEAPEGMYETKTE